MLDQDDLKARVQALESRLAVLEAALASVRGSPRPMQVVPVPIQPWYPQVVPGCNPASWNYQWVEV